MQNNLISDGSVTAQQTDKNLINPWGVAIGQQTPFWINSAGSGLSEVYDSGGNKQFVVKIPAAGGSAKTGTPTGIAFNSSTKDFILNQGSPALFIFDALDGTISAWNSSLTDAQVMVDNSASGAVYTGLAIDNTSTANFILAANLAANTIDVFDTKFAPTSLGGKFMPFEYEGRDVVARCANISGRRFDLVPRRANGQPTFGAYLRAPTGIRHGVGLIVLTLTGDRISAMTPLRKQRAPMIRATAIAPEPIASFRAVDVRGRERRSAFERGSRAPPDPRGDRKWPRS